MKSVITLIILFAFFHTGFAQNIGIGTQDPMYKLDIVGKMRLQNDGNTAPGILFDGITLPGRSMLGTINDGHTGIYGQGNTSWNFSMNVQNGNVGIGEIAPAYKMDVKGRFRIQHTSNASAGIYFDGITLPERSFAGTYTDNYTGLFGTGAGWNLVMDVTNGNTGVGTQSPTSTLDINGGLRIRSSFPKKGSVLMSSDINGNSEWEDPVAFKATGGYDDLPNNIPKFQWTKVFFNQTTAYNLGFGYQVNNSQFAAPVNGIYHFDAVLDWTEYAHIFYVRIMLNRNGNISVIAQKVSSYRYSNNADNHHKRKNPSQIFTKANLIAGDIIWVEVYVYNLNTLPTNNYPISNNNFKTWFSGHLVTRT